MTTSKFKRIGLPAALVVGGVTAGSLLAPIGLASAQESDSTEADTTEESDSTTDSTEESDSTTDSRASEDGEGRRGRGHNHRGSKADAIGEILGLERDEIKAGFEAGKTLSDLADEQGVDVEDLRSAMLDAVSERLNAAVENERIDADEAAEKLAEAEARIDEFLTTVPDLEERSEARQDRRENRRARISGFGDVVQETLGLSAEEVRQARADGQNLSELAEAQGVSAEELAAAIVANMEANIDEAVAEGNIDEERAEEIKDGLDEKVEQVLEGEGNFGRKARGNRSARP